MTKHANARNIQVSQHSIVVVLTQLNAVDNERKIKISFSIGNFTKPIEIPSMLFFESIVLKKHEEGKATKNHDHDARNK